MSGKQKKSLKNLLWAGLVTLALAGQIREAKADTHQHYFPLNVGNSWTYVNDSNGSTKTFTIIGTQEINGHTYYQFDDYFSVCGFSGDCFRYDPNSDKVLQYNGSEDVVRYDFSGNKWGEYGNQLIDIGSCTVPAGDFNDCYSFQFAMDVWCGLFYETLAPGVGNVESDIDGAEFELQSYAVDYTVVDEFDLYADSNELAAVWDDGATGADIELESGAADANLVRDGDSLKYIYDNNSFTHSEIEANTTGPNSLPTVSDWSATGAKALALYFYGDANNDGNTTERMYVALKDGTGHTAVVPYPDDTNNVKLEQWQQWNIKLQQFNDINDVNLADVEKVYIGFGDRSNTQTGTGGTGTVYFEDIRLYPTRCVPELAIASLNDDCIINYEDIKILTDEWLTTGVKADVVDDDNVNFKDYDILADFWLKEILFP